MDIDALNGFDNLTIRQVESKEDLDNVKALTREYAELLKERDDCGFQDVLNEIPKLPVDYIPPYGRLLLATAGSEVTGCAAMHRFDNQVCEIKRIFTRAQFRGKGIGRTLVLAMIEQARAIGYSAMKLSTTPVLKEAIGLYESLGFRRTDPYCQDPYPCPIFMELNLQKDRTLNDTKS